jgi:RNA polymerase-interacting CarD/CdnL/TRCF family regulator
MAESASIKLAVGDRVVYPNQGLCKVTGIESKEIAGQKLSFVSLLREEDGARVMVPEAKVVAIGVRKVANAEDVEKVLSFIRSDSDKASLDWKARARTNVERMATGGLLGLAEVVKGLEVLSELRPLPTKERELYNDARHLLVAEIAASLSILEADAEDTVDALLFPVGKERPKRTPEEFRALAGEGDDELGLDGDLMGLDGAEEPHEEEQAAAPEEGEEAAAAGDEDGEEAPKAKKAGKPAKAEAPAVSAKKTVLSDIDVTLPQASPLAEEPLKRKRGRPPKPKPEGPPPEPKKRGRPPKAKVEEPPAEPKKRGRPPKEKPAVLEKAGKKK